MLVSIPHRYSVTVWVQYVLPWRSIVSISHRYGVTTVFTAFSFFIIPPFPIFSIFFSEKVGQSLHSKFPQSLDSTGFFIFVKNSSEVHRLFYFWQSPVWMSNSKFLQKTEDIDAVNCCIHIFSLIFIHTYKGFPKFPARSDRKWFLRHGSHRYSQYPAAIHWFWYESAQWYPDQCRNG